MSVIYQTIQRFMGNLPLLTAYEAQRCKMTVKMYFLYTILSVFPKRKSKHFTRISVKSEGDITKDETSIWQLVFWILWRETCFTDKTSRYVVLLHYENAPCLAQTLYLGEEREYFQQIFINTILCAGFLARQTVLLWIFHIGIFKGRKV